MSGESTLTYQAPVEVLLECSIDLSQIPETYCFSSRESVRPSLL
jgi:hypothetical protein